MQEKTIRTVLLVAGILLIAFNMRSSIATVGPLVGKIRQDTGYSSTLLGLLTTLPVLIFGIISMFTSLFTRRWGFEITLAGALVLLTVGTLIRILPSPIALFGGTLFLGIGIAFINVLLPSFIKRDFPDHSGLMTSLYTAILGLGATLGAGIALPVAHVLGWRSSLSIWALPALLAFLVWVPQLKSRTLPKFSSSFISSVRHFGSSRMTWYIACFMGLQSFAFYVIIAWLPKILEAQGFSATNAGFMLSLSQGVGIGGSLLIPIWANRLKRQYKVIGLIGLLDFVSIVGIMFPVIPLTPLWVSLLGFSLSGSLGVAIIFMVLHTSDAKTASELSGLVQSIGYLLAAGGPTIVGLIHDLSGSWTIPLIVLMGVLFAKMLAGLGASQPMIIK